MGSAKKNRYVALLEWVFARYYFEGATVVLWSREDLEKAAVELGIELPKNLGDLVYSFRYRSELPQSITEKALDGCEWVIRGKGHGKYAFEMIKAQVRIKPNSSLMRTKLPDSTPEIIAASALGDEQALLALVRYNRLIDTFLGVTAYSLQNHLRTTATGIGQVEVDEIYVAVDAAGRQFVIPVQAKGGKDEIGITQAEQDLVVCAQKWPNMITRPVAAQFASDGLIALFELDLQDGEMRVRHEAHYQLVPAQNISSEDLAIYRRDYV
ncbi:hypothetical protein [Corynebacterium pygosceleis]|uniref:hypothetical protein n=1 Tax=Corynebacterium pygosceleis TaxID=2800406 RepID=UPI001907FBDC|nr:hypothetical protein [Corynebacterium pygosceleis]MCL0120874.1 hypothetical protein [Corynebacterium pygosceleis]